MYFPDCRFARLLQFCDIGVNFFALLSGIGISFSLAKNSFAQYFKNRFVRIYPTYWIIIIPMVSYLYINKNIDLYEALSYIVPLTFDRWWYVPFSIICYCLAPIFFLIFKKNNTQIDIGLFLFFCIFCTFLSYKSYLLYIFIRMIDFSLGLYIGINIINRDRIEEDKSKRAHELVTIISSIFFIILLNQMTHYIFCDAFKMYVFVVGTLVLLPTLCYTILQIKYLKKLFSLLGSISLEIYLLHENIVFYFLRQYLNRGAYLLLFYCLFSVCFAIVVHCSVKLFARKFVK